MELPGDLSQPLTESVLLGLQSDTGGGDVPQYNLHPGLAPAGLQLAGGLPDVGRDLVRGKY